MKKIVLLIVLISTSILSSCQTEDFMEEIQLGQDSIPEVDDVAIKIEKYMKQNSSGSVQGASCYGDYLFQFQDHNANVYIYNLKNKTFIEKVPMEPVSLNHCNNVSFSNIFYEKEDEFPLLYVSGSGSGTYNQAQVYRIFHNDNNFSFEKVQNITFPRGNDTNHMFWTQVMIDNDEGYMYVLSKSLKKDDTFISKFIIPSIENPNVYFIDDDIIEQFEVTNSVHKQGAVIHNGFLYIMYGVPQWGDTNYFRIIDLINKEDYMTINISEMGFNQEFEGLTVFNDMLIAPTNGPGIFSIKLFLK